MSGKIILNYFTFFIDFVCVIIYIISVDREMVLIKSKEFIMEVLIRKNVYTGEMTKEQKEFFIENAGKWVEIETEHLFKNQYNTKNYRIYDTHIDAVRDDARIGKGTCVYCGSLINEGEECNKHEQCKEYGVEWFTKENTFFIANPNGIADVKPCRMKDEKHFGTFRLEQLDGVLNYYRLKNERQTFKFRFDPVEQCYWLGGVLGYTKRVKSLKIGAKSFNEDKLKEYLTEQANQ